MSPQLNAAPLQPVAEATAGHGPVSVLVDRMFPATEIYVRLMVGQVIDLLAGFEIKPDFQFTVEIVLAELLNNIVEHGYGDQLSGDIELKAYLHDDRFHIETVDRGKAMPGMTAPMTKGHDLDVERAQLPEGQFGWLLIRKLSEDINYQRVGDTNRMSLAITQ